MSGVPVRLRLTAGFGLVVSLLLIAVGGAAYISLAHGIHADLDRELAQRAQDLGPVASRPGHPLDALATRGLIERGESFAEVLSADGTVVDATPTLAGKPLLTQAQAALATRSAISLTVPSAPGLDEPARLFATPIRVDGRDAVFVVGITEGNDIETLARVRHQLYVGIPLLALLTTLAGYLLMGVALGPVERMRARAATISTLTPDQRLPVTPGHDEFARLGVTLNDLLARLEAASTRQRAFVANASHELRTPLATMALELELALRRERTAEQLTESIRSAGIELARLTALAEDLLLLSTAEDDRPTPTQVELTPLLEQVAARFAEGAAGGGRRIIVSGVTGLSVLGDPGTLQRAIANLVSNALEHGQGDVALVAEPHPGAVSVHVRDRGGGLDPELVGHAFDRFTRGRSTGRSGLGLAIVETIASSYGGSVGIGDREGGGADAWIRLPALMQAPGALAGRTEAPR
jgi:signal transduction histidine kinase